MDKINWLSMIFATLMPLITGYFYYNKGLFGKIIDSTYLIDKTKDKIILVVIFLLISFFLSFFLLNFNNSGVNQEGNFDTFAHGAWHGTFIAITVVTPVVVITGWLTKKIWKHIIIHILYWIITLALMGGILDAMNHWKNIIIT